MLSAEVQKQLLAAQACEKTYRPNDKVAEKLREKTLVMFVGPTASGKSFLINHIAKTDATFARVPVFTTREPREDDEPGMFRCIPHDDANVSKLLDKIKKGEVVQYAVHPTTGRIYGTEIDDFPGEFNMLATPSDVVDHLRELPFKDTVVIGVTAEPAVWMHRFNQRYSVENEEKAKRLKEAKLSLEWLLAHPAVRWVDNTVSRPASTIYSVIDIVKYNGQGASEAARYARQIYEFLERSTA